MNIIKTDFRKQVNNSSSWIIYLTKTHEEAEVIHKFAMTQKELLTANGWYYRVSTNPVHKDCRVPEFFHDRGYWITAVEHNNGDWEKAPEYTLYIVE